MSNIDKINIITLDTLQAAKKMMKKKGFKYSYRAQSATGEWTWRKECKRGVDRSICVAGWHGRKTYGRLAMIQGVFDNRNPEFPVGIFVCPDREKSEFMAGMVQDCNHPTDEETTKYKLDVKALLAYLEVIND